MSISVIVCAAGKGSRAGFSENKLFRPLNGRTVIEHTLAAFCRADVDEILVATSPTDLARMAELCKNFPRCRPVTGGETRTQSVQNALKQIKSEIVLVHDGARPFVSQTIIDDCIASVKQYGSGVCALPATDTTVIGVQGHFIKALPREELYTLQTPQGFFTAALQRAYAQIGEEAFTDDSSVYSRFIEPAKLFVGEKRNIKLTFREDFMTIETRTGVGIDTHAFGKQQNYIVLGGVCVPAESGLIAHSDGDVLLHAVMDALLSAAGLEDIGHYFPDTDETYKDADSLTLLKTVVELLRKRGYFVHNLSAAIQAQKPKLAAYIGEMRSNIARVCGVSPDRVGISAGTNEGLGYIGEGKGVTVTAVANIGGYHG